MDIIESVTSMIRETVVPDTVFTRAKREEADRIREKYPDRIPVIVAKAGKAGDVPEIDKNKFLVPMDLTVGQFQYVIRKRLKLPPCKALFLFIDGACPPTSSLMSVVYETSRDDRTQFLFVTYSLESTFGA
jgi:GABA(A) receptor-associated protein